MTKRVLIGNSVYEDAEITLRDGILYVEFAAADLEDIAIDLRPILRGSWSQALTSLDD